MEGNRFVDIEVQAYKNGVGPTAAPTYLNGGIIFISLADPEASKPEAAINYHPSGAAANQCVFDGLPSVTTAAGAKITKYAWDVGDATTASAAAGVTTITRTFASQGDKTVALTVTDSNGNTASTATLSPELSVTQLSKDPSTLDPVDPFTESRSWHRGRPRRCRCRRPRRL